MRKILVLALGLLGFSFQIMAQQVNYFVLENQSRPFQIEYKGVQQGGIVTDVVNAIFKGSKYTLKINTLPVKRHIRTLTSGEVKNWLHYGTQSWGAPFSTNLSDIPMFTVRHYLLSKDFSLGSSIESGNVEGKSVVLLNGFDYPGLETLMQQGKVSDVRVGSYPAAFRIVDLQRDSVLGFVEMGLRIRYNLKTDNRRMEDYHLVDFFADHT